MRPKQIIRVALPCLLLSGARAQIGLHVRAITFSGDHHVLRDGLANFSSDGTGLFLPNGFEELTGTANPVSYSRGQFMSIFVDHQLLPVGGYYSLEGYSGLYGLQFYTDGLSAGYWRTDLLPALSALPNRVTTLSYAMDWQAVGQQPDPAVGGQTNTSGGPIEMCRLALLLTSACFATSLCVADQQLYPAAVLTAVLRQPANFQIGIWPDFSTAGGRDWSNARLPRAIVSAASLWTRRVVAERLLPSDLDATWRGYEGNTSSESDVACARFDVAGNRIQVMEYGGAIDVLIFPNESSGAPSSLESARALVKDMASSFLRYPAGQNQAITVNLKRATVNDVVLYRGYITCSEPQRQEDRSWWNYLTFITDGRLICFSMAEVSPGPHPQFGGASPRAVRRFRGG